MRTDDWLTFAVSDTGIGMTDEQLGGSLRRFRRGAPGKYGGAGSGSRSAATSAA
jgi:signal transduction histidine kinase